MIRRLISRVSSGMLYWSWDSSSLGMLKILLTTVNCFLLKSGSITWVNESRIAVRFTPLKEKPR